MNFLDYTKDKRYFFAFYLIIMGFVSLMMGVSQGTLSNMLYMNMFCFFIACLYIVIGYFYRRKFYLELHDLVGGGEKEIVALLPDTPNYQQKLFLELIRKIHLDHTYELQALHDERVDQQEFIMSWIHEVKLPIAASRLLIENSENKSLDEFVDKFEDELDKIDDYVEQALYYSRIDSFSKDYFITEVHVNKIIKNSVKKYSKLFINKRIRFEMSETEQFVQSDSKWLGFVIDQIMANSLKYTNEGGKIAIDFEEDGKEKRLLIQDNGIGISPADLHRVFEKGFTGSIGRSHAKSTGMGLYLAKQLAKKLGHGISIESEEGKYTKVKVHFPKIRNYYQL